MEISTVLSILRKLSDGIDPVTAEIFPNESPYQQPEIIRALITAVNALEKVQEKTVKRGKLPENAGTLWTEDEENLLVDKFNMGVKINE